MQHGRRSVRAQWNILRKPSHLSMSSYLVSYFMRLSGIMTFMNDFCSFTGKIGCMHFTWVNLAKSLNIRMKLPYHITIKLLLWIHQLLILSIGCMPHAWNYYLSAENRMQRFWRFCLFLIALLYFNITLFACFNFHVFDSCT